MQNNQQLMQGPGKRAAEWDLRGPQAGGKGITAITPMITPRTRFTLDTPYGFIK